MVEHPHEDSAEGDHDRRGRPSPRWPRSSTGRGFAQVPPQAALDQTRTSYARHTASLRLIPAALPVTKAPNSQQEWEEDPEEEHPPVAISERPEAEEEEQQQVQEQTTEANSPPHESSFCLTVVQGRDESGSFWAARHRPARVIFCVRNRFHLKWMTFSGRQAEYVADEQAVDPADEPDDDIRNPCHR